MARGEHIPFESRRLSAEEMVTAGQDFHDWIDQRRSVRFFSDAPVPRECIELAIKTASTAPSGAHKQPWTFVAVSDKKIQREIRHAAEEEERAFYEGGRATEEWLEALAPLGTDAEKPFLEEAPWLVVVFEQVSGTKPDGSKDRHYYTKESVGIACGFFIAALHRMGLVTLTHTPSPMGFLREILGRPSNERPYILFPIGLPAEDCTVPDLKRKPLEEVSVFQADDES